MDRMTRGNVLAIIKELRKVKRPRVRPYTPVPAVQAICRQTATNKFDKVADLKAVLKRRRAMVAESSRGSVDAYMATDEFKMLDDEFTAFIADYISKKDK